MIGLLAAMGPMAQVPQIASIFLIERSGLRKAAVVLSTFGSRLFWPLIAAIPWFVPQTWRIVIFLSCLLLFFSLGSISNLAFNSWMQDFVPVEIRGDYFGKRSAIATERRPREFAGCRRRGFFSAHVFRRSGFTASFF